MHYGVKMDEVKFELALVENLKEEINMTKDKMTNFGNGVKATFKNKTYYKESAKGLIWGVPIGFGIEYLKTRDLKKSAMVMAKRTPVALIFGVTVSALFNGFVAIDDPEYAEYLEED